MKLVTPLLAAVAYTACSPHHQAQPHDDDDVAVFCRAWESNGRPARISELAEYLASHLKGAELPKVFAAIPPDGDPELFDKLHAIVRAAHVTSCPTLDWMEKTYPVATATAPPVPASLVFVIGAHGSLTLSDHGGAPTELSAADLELRLRAAVARGPTTEVVVIAEPTVAIERVVGILDLVRSNGVAHLAIGLDATDVHALDTPRAVTSDAVAPAEVVIAIRANGEIAVGSKVMSETALGDVLQAEASHTPRARVVIEAVRTAPVGAVIGILDRVKRAGLTRFAIGVVPAP